MIGEKLATLYLKGMPFSITGGLFYGAYTYGYETPSSSYNKGDLIIRAYCSSLLGIVYPVLLPVFISAELGKLGRKYF